jgi:hypothetical protein
LLFAAVRGSIGASEKDGFRVVFDGWTRPPPAIRDELTIAKGRTWLVRVGWKRHGLLRPGERPGRGLDRA